MVRIAAVVLALACSPADRETCNIPVFRYALERWHSAPYEVIVFHKGPLEGDARAAVDALRAGGANVEVDHVDLDRDPSPRVRKIWEAEPGASVPWMVALFPGMDLPAWAGPASAAAATALMDSPARRELAKRLLAGDSTIWILLESGEKAKDDAAADLLEKHLRELEKSLKIPPRAPDDPPLLSDLPLKIVFSILRLSRQDPSEKTLLEMLRRSDPKVEGPAIFLVFGRGRALPPITGTELKGENFNLAGEFVAGPCACEVKEQNPGLDLLLSVDWDQALSLARAEPGIPIPDPVIPPKIAPPPPLPPAAPAEPAPARLPRPLLWAALAAAAVLVLITGTRALRRA